MASQAEQDADLKRLRWRCRRGMKELDVLFEKFLAEQFDNLTSDQQAVFRALLEEQDLDLLDWCTKKSEPRDHRYSDIISLMHSGP